MKTCPACSHQNPADALICESCGDRLEIRSGWEKTTIRDSHLEAFAPGYMVADRYEIIREIGRGGMGVVYQVRDTRLGSREMALKMIHPQLVELPEARQRFKQEVSTCLDLLHSNIVRVHNLEEWQGLQFFTMEYITGRSLHELIAERKSKKPPFSMSEAAAIITPLLDALAYAHQYTIHRDIKPDNIIVIGDFPDVTVKVLDFGIAKTLSASDLTQTAQALGTAFYMAPEQMSGGEIDQRADLYSMGMVLYEMLTGEMAVGRFQLPGEIVAELPKTVDQVIEKALESRPEQRFPDAETMSHELQKALSESQAKIKAIPGIERLKVPTKTKIKREQKKEKIKAAPSGSDVSLQKTVADVDKIKTINRTKWIVAALTLFLALSFFGGQAIWKRYRKPVVSPIKIEKATARKKLYVTDSLKLTLRSGPSSNDKILAVVTSGQQLEIQEKGEKWSKVSAPSGKQGWVLTRYLLYDPNDRNSDNAYVTNRLKITLRTGPSINDKIIAVLESGVEVNLIEQGKEWTKVRTNNGLVGWAWSRYLQEHQTEKNRLQNYLPIRTVP